MAMLLSAQTGQVVTPEELLGTSEQAVQKKLVEGEKEAVALQQKMKQARGLTLLPESE